MFFSSNPYDVIDKAESKTLLTDKERKELDELKGRYEKWNSIESKSTDVGAKKKALIRHYYSMLYHSNAIEGTRFSYSETKKWLKYGELNPNKTMKEHYEVVGLKSAFGCLTRILDRKEMLTIELIQEIHRRVLYFADPPLAGNFRQREAKVGPHKCAFYGDVPDLMELFVDRMQIMDGEQEKSSDEQNVNFFTNDHPLLCAALAHFALVNIHPWGDGNGRTSRLVMNYWMMRAGYPPIIIPVGSHTKYCDALQMGHEGNLRPFVHFIFAQTKRSIRSILRFHHRFERLNFFHHLPLHLKPCYLCCLCPSQHHQNLVGLHFNGMHLEMASSIRSIVHVAQSEFRYELNKKIDGLLDNNDGPTTILSILLESFRNHRQRFEGDSNITILFLGAILLELGSILLDMGFSMNHVKQAFSDAFQRVEANNQQLLLQLQYVTEIKLVQRFKELSEEKHADGVEGMLNQLMLAGLANAFGKLAKLSISDSLEAKQSAWELTAIAVNKCFVHLQERFVDL